LETVDVRQRIQDFNAGASFVRSPGFILLLSVVAIVVLGGAVVLSVRSRRTELRLLRERKGKMRVTDAVTMDDDDDDDGGLERGKQQSLERSLVKRQYVFGMFKAAVVKMKKNKKKNIKSDGVNDDDELKSVVVPHVVEAGKTVKTTHEKGKLDDVDVDDAIDVLYEDLHGSSTTTTTVAVASKLIPVGYRYDDDYHEDDCGVGSSSSKSSVRV
jgi:hypothetical protein